MNRLPEFAVGDYVKITSGMFEGQTGVIFAISEHSAEFAPFLVSISYRVKHTLGPIATNDGIDQRLGRMACNAFSKSSLKLWFPG